MKDNDELIGLLVHSYNNYLAGMMGYSELALLNSESFEDSSSIVNVQQTRDFIQQSMLSGKEAVYFSQCLLASISRLQCSFKDVALTSLFEKIKHSERIKGFNFLNFHSKELESNEQCFIKTDSQWFTDCLCDLVGFVKYIAKNELIELTFSVNKKQKIMDVCLGNNQLKLTDRQQMELFQPYYSSRKFMGTKDIGLAKAKGFFSQTKVKLDWENNKGFVIEIPFYNEA